MTDATWHDYKTPPDSDRRIMLRFGPSGIHDVIGRYDARFGAYYIHWNAARRGEFVHPVQWRELEQGGGDMSDAAWIDASSPPDSDRVVILRFGTSGLHDCEGRYHAEIGGYVRRYSPAVSIWAVRPTSWREVFTGERY